jgi:hypothetical protein
MTNILMFILGYVVFFLYFRDMLSYLFCVNSNSFFRISEVERLRFKIKYEIPRATYHWLRYKLTKRSKFNYHCPECGNGIVQHEISK